MSSLGDIQQIHSMLQQISRLLDEIDTKTDTTTKKAQASIETFNNLEAVALRYLTITRRFGLPENIEQAITTITSLIVALRMAQTTLASLQLSMGPIGWAGFAASGALTAMSFGSIGYDMMRGT
jgi:hypothetical protein